MLLLLLLVLLLLLHESSKLVEVDPAISIKISLGYHRLDLKQRPLIYQGSIS
jgi:hypothetical protein